MDEQIDLMFVYASIGPHIATWLNTMSAVMRTGVIVMSGFHSSYDWQNTETMQDVKCHFLADQLDAEDVGKDEILIRKASDILRARRPTYLLQARYDLPITRRLCDVAHDLGIKSVLMSDSWEGVKKRRWWKEAIKRRLLQSKFDAVLVAGSRSCSYAKQLGFDSSKIGSPIDVVDNQYFRERRLEIVGNPNFYREEFALPDDYFLVIARHYTEKNLYRLLSAYQQYVKDGGRTHLVLLGSGPQSDSLQRYAYELGIQEFTSFRGWIDYQQTPVFLSLAKALFLVSVQETWGLVVNEAMASEIPVVVTESVGCSADLVRHGWNGWVVNAKNINDIANAFRMADDAGNEELTRMGRRGAKMIEDYSLSNRCNGIAKLLSQLN